MPLHLKQLTKGWQALPSCVTMYPSTSKRMIRPTAWDGQAKTCLYKSAVATVHVYIVIACKKSLLNSDARLLKSDIFCIWSSVPKGNMPLYLKQFSPWGRICFSFDSVSISARLQGKARSSLAITLPCFCPFYRSIPTRNEVFQKVFP